MISTAPSPLAQSSGMSGLFSSRGNQSRVSLFGGVCCDVTTAIIGYTPASAPSLRAKRGKGKDGNSRSGERKMHFDQDRRSIERIWLHRGALIIIAGVRGVHSCGIRDLNRGGAGLRLNRILLLPTDFKMSFDGVRHTFGCHLIWRDGDFAGVAFQPASDGQ
jgi:hypothetical protein